MQAEMEEEEDEFGNLYADLGPEARWGSSIRGVGGDGASPSREFVDSDGDEQAEALFGKVPPPPSFNPNSPDDDEELFFLSFSHRAMPREQPASVGPPQKGGPVTVVEDDAASPMDVVKGAPLPSSLATTLSPSSLRKEQLPSGAEADEDGFTSTSVPIPGLSICAVAPSFKGEPNRGMGDEWQQKGGTKHGSSTLAPQDSTRATTTTGAVADWDSDSEDDLRIVLNEEHPTYPCFEKVAATDNNFEASEDEDEEDLVIVAGGEPLEDQEWGEDQSLATDGLQATLGNKSLPVGDRQVGTAEGLAAKTGQAIGMVPQGVTRMGYSGHVYHHHSQYKYVRPSSTSVSGVGTSPVGQVTNNRITLGKGDVGRGDWTGPGRGLYGSQRMAQVPYWNAGASRGFQYGYEFNLPPAKTAFDIDIDSLEEKPWRHPGVDITDFFNFGFNESSWKDYCKQLVQLRLESTMQSKIRVYESGRSEQDYDPDLPPELVAVSGLNEASGENTQARHFDTDMMVPNGRVAGHLDLTQAGRAIQVEGGFGDRLPSSDNRRPRFRDCDAIILHEAEEEELIKTQDTDENVRFDEEGGIEDVEEEDIERDEKVEPEFVPNDGAQFSSEVSRKIIRKIALLPSGLLQASEENESLPGVNERDISFNLNSETQVVKQKPAAVLSSVMKESYSSALERHKMSRPSSIIKEPHSNEDVHVDHSDGSNGHHESYSTGEIKLNEGYARVSPDRSKRSKTPEILASGKSPECIKEVSVVHESDKHDRTSVEEGLIQDGSPAIAHHADDSLSGEKERLSLQGDSHVSSPSRRTPKKHLDHGVEEMPEDNQGLELMQHKRQGEICQEGEMLDDEDDTYSQRQKDTFWTNMQHTESETVLQAETSDEHLRRIMEKGKLTDHYADRDDNLNYAYNRRKERENYLKQTIDFRKKERSERSKSREGRHQADMSASRRKMDVESRKNERTDREAKLRHRERDSKISRCHNDEDNPTFRRTKEDELRRRDRPENEPKERNKYHSERRAAREQDLCLRRREEDIWRRERIEEYQQRKGREEIWAERDNADRRKGMHRDVHGRREREDKKSAQFERSRRPMEEKARHATSMYAREAIRIPSNDRARKKEKHKSNTEQVKDRDMLEGIRETEGRNRSRNLVFEEQARNDTRNDFRTYEEHRLQTARRKSSLHRNSELNADKVASGSPFLKDRNHYNYADIGLNSKEENNQSARDRSSTERRLVQKVESAQNFPNKQQSPRIIETMFSEEDEPRQKGRSKLERWASQRGRDNQGICEPELRDIKQKKDAGNYNAAVQDTPSNSHEDLCRKSDISRHDDSKTADDDQKTNNNIEHVRCDQHDVEQDEEHEDNEGDNTHANDFADIGFADEDQEHFHQPLKQQHLDMAAKLEKRKERFKHSITEEKELRRRMDNENSQQIEEEVKAERPARKRRWGAG